MKLKQLGWLANFIWVLSLFVALNGLLKLHSLRQPLLPVIGEAILFATLFSLFDWVRKHGDD